MLRELIEKEAAAVKGAFRAVRERVHPTTRMKSHAFDRPLDDLGQTIDDVEARLSMQEHGPRGTRT
jgi:hypothetical protein